jgi:Tfp pilus assembly protein PilF
MPEKALASTVNQKGSYSPQPIEAELRSTERTPHTLQPEAHALDSNQKAAAKVFVANQSVKSPSSIGALLLLGVGGALIILLGMKGYQYWAKPAPVLVQHSASLTEPSVAEPSVAEPSVAEPSVAEPSVAGSRAVVAESKNEQIGSQSAVLPANDAKNTELLETADKSMVKEVVDSPVVKSAAVVARPAKQRENRLDKNDERAAAVESNVEVTHKAVHNMENQTPLRLSSKTSAATVDPTLLAAYQAFNRGEDAAAQQQYREVLKRDIRNVDALLGMAAIAQRQGREADAAGWYQKILDVEPQNSIAQSALASPQTNLDATSAESRIKNMLAQQPEAAHLHAALGNIYAEQNQWASAQGAYFNASRFDAKNADYAFNVAVSLEHMGKKSLALLQYQRALTLLNESGGASPDRATLEARIQALQ